MKTLTLLFNILLYLLSFSISFAQSNQTTDCNEKDAQILLQIKNTFNSEIQKQSLRSKLPKKQTKNTKDWTIEATYQIPGKASGLAWDGAFLYSGIYGSAGDEIYKINPTDGSYSLLCNGPQEDAYGLTHDGTNIWTTDHAGSSSDPALALKMDENGNLLSSFSLPNHYMSGIAYDNGDFWVQTYYPDPGTIYKLDDTGTILSQFQPPAGQPWDICTIDQNLWVVDYNANMIYEIDQTGTVLSSHTSENVKPAGIVYDGQYLWYCDGGLGIPSTLYKINLLGSGNPVIDVVPTDIDFGFVSIDDTSTANFTVYNNGSADLIVNFGDFSGQGSQYLSWGTSQITLSPSTNQTVSVIFNPTTFTTLDAIGEINSNDPLAPTLSMNIIGQSVFEGPTVGLQTNSHDFGNVRKNALTRWFMQIQNQGDATLTIDNITSDNSSYFLDETIEFPFNIGIMQNVQIGVWFNPTDAISYNAMLNIESNDVNSPATVTLNGTGIEQDYSIGDELWYFDINTGSDNSPKAIHPISDINGDSIDDVIICSEDNFIRCFNGNSHNLADVLWELEIYSGNIFNQHGLTTVTDLDGDDIDEVVVGTTGIDKSIHLISGKTGDIIWTHHTNDYGDGGWVYQVDAKYDFNSDGVRDILATAGDDASDTGPKRVYCLNGSTGVTIWDTYLGGPGFSVIGIEDFNNDNVADVISGSSNEDETQGKILGLNGITGNIEWTINTTGTSVWALTQIDDINADGIKEVVAGDFSGYYYYVDATNGDLLYTGNLGTSLILDAVSVEDVNSDGFSDVTFSRSSTSAIMLNGANGSNIWSKPLADKAWNVRKITDISGDAINDVVVGTLFSNNYVYFLNGTTGDIIEQISYPSPIDAINVIPDIVGDLSEEVVVGGRLGEVKCLSGGLDHAINVEDYSNALMKVKVFPNPFTTRTAVEFELLTAANISIQIYDLTGKCVKSVGKTKFTQGLHKVYWDGKNDTGNVMDNGIYIFELRSENFITKDKIILCR